MHASFAGRSPRSCSWRWPVYSTRPGDFADGSTGVSVRENPATRSSPHDGAIAHHPQSPSTKGEDHTGRNHRIADWNPEDAAAWEAGNKDIARRNLLVHLAGDHVAFSIWTLWPVMALFMPASVYGFSAGDKLLLGAVATLVGGCARIPYTPGHRRLRRPQLDGVLGVRAADPDGRHHRVAGQPRPAAVAVRACARR